MTIPPTPTPPRQGPIKVQALKKSGSCCPPKAAEQPCCPPSPREDTPKAACCPPPVVKTSPAESACCPPPKIASSCCPGDGPREKPGYRLSPFVQSWLDTPAGEVPQVATVLAPADLLGRWQMRWGLGRDRYRIAPGLYAVGNPGTDSPVLVSANYKLSFDVLRRDTAGLDAWILVLDTKGINVWCAAGKGTFGTDEIVRRVKATGLDQVVSHRRLIVPQLGAPGIAAHEVKKSCGFLVLYGPVRARDIQAFCAAGMQAAPEMRRVTFSTWERTILTPVEISGLGRKILWAALILLALGGIGESFFSLHAAWIRGGSAILAGLAGLLAGAVVTPILLPWLPGRAFALKGAVAGIVFAFAGLLVGGSSLGAGNGAALVLALPAVASFTAMNFTGSTTFTSPSGVEKEMRRAIPVQAVALVTAAIFWIGAAF